VARHEDIVNTIWDDLDHLSNDAFMLYVWSWTNTKCGMAGMYPVTRRTLLEGRLENDVRDAALAELEADDKLYFVESVLWNKARVSHLNGFEKGRLSPVIVRSIEKDLEQINRSNPLIGRFVDRYAEHPSLADFLTLYRPSPDGQRTALECGGSDGLETVQGQGQGQGQGDVDPVLRSVLATLEQVAFGRNESSPSVEKTTALCQQFAQLDLPAQAEKFAHYWTGPRSKAAMPGSEVLWAFRVWLETDNGKAPKVTKAPTGKRDRSAYDAVVEAAS